MTERMKCKSIFLQMSRLIVSECANVKEKIAKREEYNNTLKVLSVIMYNMALRYRMIWNRMSAPGPSFFDSLRISRSTISDQIPYNKHLHKSNLVQLQLRCLYNMSGSEDHCKEMTSR